MPPAAIEWFETTRSRRPRNDNEGNDGMKASITPQDVRDVIATLSDEDIQFILDEGLMEIISYLEQDDFFGTEGFNKRFG